MEKKTIIPFDLEMAKKIQSGEIEGRIITKKGNTARIICFDAESACNYSIIGLVKDSDSNFEECCRYFTDGTRDRENDELNSLVIELFVYPVNENIIEPPEEIQLNNCKESEDYRKGYEYGYKTATEIIESITYLKSKKLESQFKPFDKVLVRDNEKQVWLPRLFDSHVEQADFWTQDGKSWKMCIPYEGNESLVGTTDKP